MRAFNKHNSVYFGIIMVVSFLFLYSCERDATITRYLRMPGWIEVNKVSSTRVNLRWEPIEEAEQYVVYKTFAPGSYSSHYTEESIRDYASRYEVARTATPEYQYHGSYDPSENGYNRGYSCYFGVRVVDKNGNMSDVRIEKVPEN